MMMIRNNNSGSSGSSGSSISKVMMKSKYGKKKKTLSIIRKKMIESAFRITS